MIVKKELKMQMVVVEMMSLMTVKMEKMQSVMVVVVFHLTVVSDTHVESEVVMLLILPVGILMLVV